MNPDPLGCSLAVLALYHDVSHTVEANSLTNYWEIRNIFVTGTKMDVIPDIFQPQLLMSDLNINIELPSLSLVFDSTINC